MSYRSLLLLEELSKDEALSQRDLSKKMGIALGLVNSYIKNMIAKGYVRVSSFPKNRYSYLLTPKGIAEKSRLTYQHLHYFTNLYTNVRKDFSTMFRQLEKSGVKKVLFCGVDEVAEIACLSLQETDMELSGVIDIDPGDRKFFRHTVFPMDDLNQFEYDRIIISSLKKGAELLEILKNMGIEEDSICHVDNEWGVA
ncbi:MAG: winged helix-turn-helix transcriptional regulator [Proteobacteria bacterium]|nr:winged helix-turn-helix transcriptional regulator [Pseudomonadota bacterium]